MSVILENTVIVKRAWNSLRLWNKTMTWMSSVKLNWAGFIDSRGQGLFPAGVAFFKSKDPKCDGSESQFICELDHMNQHLSKDVWLWNASLTSSAFAPLSTGLLNWTGCEWLTVQGPYIGGQYLTSADIALAPKLYVLQTALAYYKNWTNFEQFYPALNKFMKVRQVPVPLMYRTIIITAPWSQFRLCLKASNSKLLTLAWLANEIVAADNRIDTHAMDSLPPIVVQSID